jgi:hypothetical protein
MTDGDVKHFSSSIPNKQEPRDEPRADDQQYTRHRHADKTGQVPGETFAAHFDRAIGAKYLSLRIFLI